jgi:hypothetical protein
MTDATARVHRGDWRRGGLPLVARAQQPKLPIVGLLNGVSFGGPYAVPVAEIRQDLQEASFVEGRNLAIE